MPRPIPKRPCTCPPREAIRDGDNPAACFRCGGRLEQAVEWRRDETRLCWAEAPRHPSVTDPSITYGCDALGEPPLWLCPDHTEEILGGTRTER